MTSESANYEFLRLWSEHARQVYAYIFSLVANCADADDVFQETSLTLMEKFGEFDRSTSFSAWACRVAYFKSLSLLKTRRVYSFLDASLLERIEPLIRETLTNSEDKFEALAHCLGKLSDKDRQLIKIRYQEERSVEDVAKQVGRQATGIYKSLRRIHEALLDCIRRRLAQGERS